ncbi:hypothetical protein L226DRAFT_88366 [Lentinus tigrinus ALCF2SS1-7]|uniref:uncharacterized protein n=1 Tax=Lentinus tigrinus ALCF2SS1-7 TaxID=1328758 RepID=UPI001165D04D|nr:hypothetical protein L226DRAFT_88366 [Lentinus tigrinus ALCF2SS1-7]
MSIFMAPPRRSFVLQLGKGICRALSMGQGTRCARTQVRRNVVIMHRMRQVSRADELVVMTLDRMRYLGSGRGVLVKCQAGGRSSGHQKDSRSFTPPAIEMQGTEGDCQICRGISRSPSCDMGHTKDMVGYSGRFAPWFAFGSEGGVLSEHSDCARGGTRGGTRGVVQWTYMHI